MKSSYNLKSQYKFQTFLFITLNYDKFLVNNQKFPTINKILLKMMLILYIALISTCNSQLHRLKDSTSLTFEPIVGESATYKQYPSIIEYILKIDNSQIALRYNNSFNIHREDSQLPLMHYSSAYVNSQYSWSGLNQLYYYIGYQVNRGIMYSWKQKQICVFQYIDGFKIGSMLDDGYRTYALLQDKAIKILQLDQNCNKKQITLQTTPIPTFTKIHDLNSKQLLIVTDTKIIVVQKQTHKVLQQIVPTNNIAFNHRFNVTGIQGNENFTIYSFIQANREGYYQVYGRRSDYSQFYLIISDYIGSVDQYVDFDEKSANFLDYNCNILNVSLLQRIIIPNSTKQLLGKPVGFNRKFSLYARPDGSILNLNKITLQLTLLFKLPVSQGQTVKTAKIINESHIFFTTSQRVLYHYYAESQKLVKVSNQADALKSVEDEEFRYYTSSFVFVFCQNKTCGIYNFFLNDTFELQQNITIFSESQNLHVQQFVEDKQQNSVITYYYLIVSNDKGQLQAFGLNRTSSAKWSIINKQTFKIQPDYQFSKIVVTSSSSNLNYTTLVFSKVLQNGTTQITSYSVRYNRKDTYQHQNLYSFAAFFSPRMLYIYNSRFVKTSYTYVYPDAYADYIPNINKAVNIVIIDQSTVYYEINDMGKFAKINKQNMRIQSDPIKIPKQFCPSLSNVSIFRHHKSKQSVFLKVLSDDRIYVVSRVNSTQNYTEKILNLAFSSIQLRLKSISLNQFTNQVYMLAFNQLDGTQNLLYQKISNFAYGDDLTWRHRYTNSKISSYSSSFSKISWFDGTNKIKKYIKNQGAVKVPKIYLKYHVSKSSNYLILCDATPSTQITLKCYKKNFITNQTLSTINDPPYSLDYTGQIVISPSGYFTQISTYVYKDSEKIGQIFYNKNECYTKAFMNDHTLICIGLFSIGSTNYVQITSYRIEQHPFNYSILSSKITSAKQISYSFNQTHICYIANDTFYLVDQQFKVVASFQNQIGHNPKSIYLMNDGHVYANWNTLLYKWNIMDSSDNGGTPGFVIAIVVVGCVALLVGISVVGFKMYKLYRSRSEKSANLIAEQAETVITK